MKITTIQLHEGVKSELDSLKQGKESYEDVIQKLVHKGVKAEIESGKLKTISWGIIKKKHDLS